MYKRVKNVESFYYDESIENYNTDTELDFSNVNGTLTKDIVKSRLGTKSPSTIKKVKIGKDITALPNGIFYRTTVLGAAEVEFVAGSKLKTIGGGAFSGSPIRGTLTIPASVETIGWDAFKGCVGLTSLEFEANSNLKTIGPDAFNSSRHLAGTLTIPASVETIGKDAFKACVGLTSLVFEAGSRLKTIGEGAFSSTNLKVIIVESNSNVFDIVRGHDDLKDKCIITEDVSKNNSKYYDKTSQSCKVLSSECVSGTTYESQAPGPNNDRICAPVSPSCGKGEDEIQAPGPNNDRVCKKKVSNTSKGIKQSKKKSLLKQIKKGSTKVTFKISDDEKENQKFDDSIKTGDTIVFSPRTPKEERRLVTGKGSVLLNKKLEHDHDEIEIIRQDKKSSNLGLIIGGSVGGGVVLIVLIIYFVYLRR